MTSFHETYETDTVDLKVNGVDFHLHTPADLNRFIDPENPLKGFPLWSKIWEASLVLSDHLARLAPEPGKPILEIGGGLGLIGVVAAAFGHDITTTEYDPHALAFARANADANGCPQLKIVRLDWHAPVLTGRFARIVASEVAYRDSDFDPIMNLFRTYLEPDGEIVLACGVRRTSLMFLDRMRPAYHIRAKKMSLKGGAEAIGVILARITPK